MKFEGKNAKRDLSNHIKKHQMKSVKISPVYSCSFCNKEYKTKQLLNRHKLQSCKEHLQWSLLPLLPNEATDQQWINDAFWIIPNQLWNSAIKLIHS